MPKGNRRLVKCIVCGEIFDSELDVCPVCGVGRDYFIPYEEEDIGFRKDTKEKFVILGNGAAGISAAEAIRERNETCSITMISREAEYSYNRPMLTKSLSSLVSAEEILIHPMDWYEENSITNILNAEIIKLDTQNKSILLGDGRSIPYDKCIYALGAECFNPPVKGSDKPEVIAIRNMADVKKAKALGSAAKRAVVIGGGVLGLEAAWELSKLCEVTVLEVADKLMVRQLDDKAGEILGELIKKAGIQFRVNASITEIMGEDKVTGVALKDGETYPADLVIISCGIRANVNLARDCGIIVNKAIVVNEKMETSKEDIYACGDCAEYQCVNYAVWSQAIMMGKIAGVNAAGENETYELNPPALSFEGMNTALFAGGDNGKNPELEYQELEYSDADNGRYEKYYFNEKKLVGAILIGDTRKMVKVTEGLNVGCSINYIQNNIIHP
ncbi:FAD-dependent oxidoreductase [Anaerocolumna xylanovorans]|uniref:Pyridine nucleotide-disulphide oxidoreductase n=1 Tax=Anaerocolumna xylanovorans DSM 12503 TaxID=1121345 RepID=A0A1M7YH18_9FIRM|nr:FAD-dependent oxidoreductase [Anaerocolumna xylanovorans]SHO51893.1 Pyridine nucleotide-disulphide oxidoreductase [Anaerocolumna xylanovorans DSM 12503]